MWREKISVFFESRVPGPRVAIERAMTLGASTFCIFTGLELLYEIIKTAMGVEYVSGFIFFLLFFMFVVSPINVVMCLILWLFKLDCFIFTKKRFLVIEPLILLGMFFIPTADVYIKLKWWLYQYWPSVFEFHANAGPYFQLSEPWYIWLPYHALPYILTAIVLIIIQKIYNLIGSKHPNQR